MLTLENLSISLGDKSIIKSLSADFKSGDVNGIFGLNGIGKTTLFNCIYGLVKYSGEIMLDNRPVIKDDISYMMAETYFYPNLLGKEYLTMFENKTGPALFDIDKLAEALCVPVHENIDTFSTGMKKKFHSSP